MPSTRCRGRMKEMVWTWKPSSSLSNSHLLFELPYSEEMMVIWHRRCHYGSVARSTTVFGKDAFDGSSISRLGQPDHRCCIGCFVMISEFSVRCDGKVCRQYGVR